MTVVFLQSNAVRDKYARGTNLPLFATAAADSLADGSHVSVEPRLVSLRKSISCPGCRTVAKKENTLTWFLTPA